MTEQEIHTICKEYKIKNYSINPDGSIDVDDSVDLFNYNLNKIPLKFIWRYSLISIIIYLGIKRPSILDIIKIFV